MTWAVVYIVVGVLASVVVSGWTFAYFQGKFPRLAVIDSYRREHFLLAFCYGAVTVLAWPGYVPMVWWMSERARFGCWRVRRAS